MHLHTCTVHVQCTVTYGVHVNLNTGTKLVRHIIQMACVIVTLATGTRVFGGYIVILEEIEDAFELW